MVEGAADTCSCRSRTCFCKGRHDDGDTLHMKEKINKDQVVDSGDAAIRVLGVVLDDRHFLAVCSIGQLQVAVT